MASFTPARLLAVLSFPYKVKVYHNSELDTKVLENVLWGNSPIIHRAKKTRHTFMWVLKNILVFFFFKSSADLWKSQDTWLE